MKECNPLLELQEYKNKKLLNYWKKFWRCSNAMCLGAVS